MASGGWHGGWLGSVLRHVPYRREPLTLDSLDSLPLATHPVFGIKLAFSEPSLAMSKVCQVTGKRPMSGNNVSHAHNKTRRTFEPNLHHHRFWVPSENRFVRLRVSAAGMRVIDKKGIEAVLKDIEKRESSGKRASG